MVLSVRRLYDFDGWLIVNKMETTPNQSQKRTRAFHLKPNFFEIAF